VKYLLMICLAPEVWDGLTEDQRREVFRTHDRFQQLVADSGEYVATEALADPSHSVTVRVHGGRPVVTDGPFAESKEYLAGYYVLDCESRERAAELAGLLAETRFGAVEVRPLMTFG
jgi:hypothetical protein